MASRSEGSLVEEINYLTNLIQSHQTADRGHGKRQPRGKHKWNARYLSSHSPARGRGGRHKPHGSSKPHNHRNMVYRPQENPQSQKNKFKDTSVVFIKQEGSSNKIAYSLPPHSCNIQPSTATGNSNPRTRSDDVRLENSVRGNSFAGPPADNVSSMLVKREPADDMARMAGLSKTDTGSPFTRGRERSRSRGRGRGQGSFRGKGRGRGQSSYSAKGSGSFKSKHSGRGPSNVPSRPQLKWQREVSGDDGVACAHPAVQVQAPLCSTPRSSDHPHKLSSTPVTPLQDAFQSATPIPTYQPTPHRPPPPFPTVQSPLLPLPCSNAPGPSATPTATKPRPRKRRSRKKSRQSNYKWKRQSTPDAPTLAPSLGKGSHKNNRYRWKRRSNSGAPAQPPIPQLGQPHAKSAANGASKSCSKYMWKRRGSLGNSAGLTTPNFSRHRVHHKGVMAKNKYKLKTSSVSHSKKIVQKALKHAYKKYHSNKVWVAPQAPRVDSDDDVVFICEDPPGTLPQDKRPISTLAIAAASHPLPNSSVIPSKLVGYEKKTKRGNKQWVGVRVKPVSTLRSSRARMQSKNRKWEPGRESRLQGVAKKKFESSMVRRSLTRWRPPSVVCFDGGKYTMDPTGKRLKRLSVSSSSALSLGGGAGWSGNVGGVSASVSGYLGTARSSFIKRKMASRLVKKSQAFVWHARVHRKLNKYCVFYNRFGKCNKGKDCHYVHDPARIAVCPKFLKGTCDKTDGECLLSHKIDKGKMPTCAFFLRGMCGRDNCPYLHVSVGQDVKVCPDFIKGFCPRGEQCTLQHRFDCPSFSLTGTCPQGSKCPLLHKKKTRTRKRVASQGDSIMESEPRAFKKVRLKLEEVVARAGGVEKGDQVMEDNLRRETDGGEGGGGGGGGLAVTNGGTEELDFIPLDMNVTALDFIPL